MILRKPYAVFIKYFKLLHTIIAAFAIFLLHRTFVIYKFFDSYSVDYRSVLGDFSVEKYISIYSFVCIVVILVILIMLLSVMIYKKKPKNLYIYSLILYIGIFVLYMFSSSALQDINSVMLDIKLSKAIRDFSLIALVLQIISTVLTVVRATGFDIKQFDFATDLQKLDISDKDSEEIEVAVSFDKDEAKRNLKYRIRNIKYVYVEHKFLINMVALIVISVISIVTYLKISAYTERYSTGKTFSVSNVTMNVQESYILQTDPKGNALLDTEGNDAGVIVAIRAQLKGYGIKEEFNTGLVTLKIGDLSYSQNPDYASELYDLGTPYINQYLTEEFKTYIFTFEVSEKQARKNMKLKINDNYSFVGGEVGAKNVLVNLKPTDLRDNDRYFEKKLGETIDLSESTLGSTTLKINSYDINNKFKLPYKYCYSKDKCIDSIEYVTATATGNYFKTLMSINADFSLDKNINVTDIYDLRTLFNTFGTINYKINDNNYSKKINSEQVKPKSAKTNNVFIEVPYEIKDASEISISLKIRNKSYKYILK